jgi:hypothetical protein
MLLHNLCLNKKFFILNLSQGERLELLIPGKLQRRYIIVHTNAEAVVKGRCERCGFVATVA